MQPKLVAVALAFIAVSGCTPGFLTLEVRTGTLDPADIGRIASLEVVIAHDGGSPARAYPVTNELQDGVTDIAVRLGGASGLATFTVQALDAAGASISTGQATAELAEGSVVVVVLGEISTDSGLDAFMPDGGEPDAGDTGTDAGSDGAVPCMMEGEQTCQGNDLYLCSSGAYVLDEACIAGCVDLPTPHCGVIVPSNGLDAAWLTEPTAPFDANGDGFFTYVFDTDTGEILGDGMVLRAAGTGVVAGIGFHAVTQGASEPEIGAWTFTYFDLPASDIATVVGDAAGAFVVTTTIVVDGVIDAGARPDPMLGENMVGGPGGFRGGEWDTDIGNGLGMGGGPGFGSWIMQISAEDPGGGGAGYGGSGGDGGPTPLVPGPIPGGIPYGSPTLIPLVGGSGGAASGGPSAPTPIGGGGGGALQLVAGESIDVAGVITVAGGFGGPGIGQDGGGGGGAGGALLLEAPGVTVSGFLAANGGGGGSGATQLVGSVGLPGERGRSDDVAALGGASIGAEAGAGGSGGAGDSCDGLAGDMEFNGGGGGGACGRVRINTATGAASLTGTLSPSAASGLASGGTLVLQ